MINYFQKWNYFAQQIDDLQSKVGHNKKDKGEANEADEVDPVVPPRPDKGRGRGRGRGGRGDRGRGRGRGKGRGGKGRQPMLCVFHYNGNCLKGETCDMIHLDSAIIDKHEEKQSEANVTEARDAKERWLRAQSKVTGDDKDSSKEKRKPPGCYNWEDSGKCEKGDQCRYSHDTREETHTAEEANVADYVVGAIDEIAEQHFKCFEWECTGQCSTLNCSFLHEKETIAAEQKEC